jgi:FKBP-type peptidyl-prolyl cis-trans isomerase
MKRFAISCSNVTVTILKGNNAATDQTVTGNALTESTTQIITTTVPEEQTNVPVTYTVKIVNNFGSLFYSSKKTGDTFTIPVDNLRKGNYLVQISDGKTVLSQTLIISS